MALRLEAVQFDRIRKTLPQLSYEELSEMSAVETRQLAAISGEVSDMWLEEDAREQERHRKGRGRGDGWVRVKGAPDG